MKTKTYDVQIEAIVTKTIRVNAIDEDAAYDLAHEIFTVTRDDHEERYEQHMLNIFEVGDEEGGNVMSKEAFADSLDHWAKCFRDGTLDDSFANEIAYLLEDKAHDLRVEDRHALSNKLITNALKRGDIK